MKILSFLFATIVLLHAPVVFGCVDFDAVNYPIDPTCTVGSNCALWINITILENNNEVCSTNCACVGEDPTYIGCTQAGTAAIFHPNQGSGGIVEFTSPTESGLVIPTTYIAPGWYGSDYEYYNWGEWWENGYNC